MFAQSIEQGAASVAQVGQVSQGGLLDHLIVLAGESGYGHQQGGCPSD